MVGITIALFLLATASPAASLPQNVPIVSVPATLPASVKAALDATRLDLIRRVDAHNTRVDAFTTRCSRVVTGSAEDRACAADYQTMVAAQTALDRDKKAFSDAVAAAVAREACAPFDAQLARDNAAMSQLMKMQRLTLAELQGATRDALDAQKDAVIGGGKLLLDASVKQLEGRAGSARAFKGWITRNSAAATQRGANVNGLLAQADAALANYARAQATAEAGAIASKALEVKDLFASLTAVAQSTYALQQRADADLAAVMADPTVKALGSDLVRGVADTLSAASELARFSPHYAVGAYVADYLQHGFKWWLSLKQIEDQSQVLGTEAQAIQALQTQIARTTTRLRNCRAK